MTKILCSGDTEYGYISGLTISGEKMVDQVTSSNSALEEIISERLKTYDGSIGNDYHPEQGSMLQAYIFMVELFGEEAVHVKGELETIPYEEGVIF